MSNNNQLSSLTTTLAIRLGLGDGTGLIETLKATAFRGPVSESQMAALLIVSNQYGLNPWTKEIYAFPDSNNGIVPVVGVDGWARIMNECPQFDGMEFVQSDESCTCIIHRKDRSHPVKVTEYLDECKRGTGPWKSHPKRMLRHKSMIQCARLAFGFVGIYDQDEAERILEKDVRPAATQKPEPKQIPAYPDDKIAANAEAWVSAIKSGKTTAESIIAKIGSAYALDDDQIEAIRAIEAHAKGEQA